MSDEILACPYRRETGRLAGTSRKGGFEMTSPEPPQKPRRTPAQMILAVLGAVVGFAVAYFLFFHLGAWMAGRH
jgi:hypothetical protein